MDSERLDTELPQCHFPLLIGSVVRPPGIETVAVNISKDHETQARLFCEENAIHLMDVFQTVWALILRCYVDSDVISFVIQETEASVTEQVACYRDVYATKSAAQLLCAAPEYRRKFDDRSREGARRFPYDTIVDMRGGGIDTEIHDLDRVSFTNSLEAPETQKRTR